MKGRDLQIRARDNRGGARFEGGSPQRARTERIPARNFAITTSGLEDPVALRFCIDKIGADRIMWAIDYPYQPTAPAVAFLESSALSDEERATIAHLNAGASSGSARDRRRWVFHCKPVLRRAP